jgi:pantetheine-phosphate adenylyltransferase
VRQQSSIVGAPEGEGWWVPYARDSRDGEGAAAAGWARAGVAADGGQGQGRPVQHPRKPLRYEIDGGARPLCRRALAQLARAGARFDGVLADPPYERGLLESTLSAVAEHGLVRPGGWMLVEHHTSEMPPPACGRLRLTQSRRYGKTGLALYVAEENMSEPQRPPEMIRRAVYAGSFDPITNGHLDVIRRALAIFDEVIVAVASGTSDPRKERALFSHDERVTMIREALVDTPRGKTDSFTGLLVDYCDQVGARAIIRGLRAVSDFEYEFQMAMMNRHLKPHIETFFMAAGETHFYTASRLVKEVASLGGDVRGLVPDSVHKRLMKKLRPEH